jgi:hypothetical protein
MSVILGVLGARNAITKQIMQDEIIGPILDDLKGIPKKMILPAEPVSSTYIECWATRHDIPVELIKSDWAQDGRRAGVVRDYRIEKESTALLIFEGPKSRYYVDLAERIAKKHSHTSYPVYLVNANSITPVLLEVDRVQQMGISEKDERDILTLPKLWSKNTQTKCMITED